MTPQQAYGVIESTWPPADVRRATPWTIRDGKDGGKRVSAATLDGDISGADISLAECAMQDLGQQNLFMIRDGDDPFDQKLEALGYDIIDPVAIYSVDVSRLTDKPIPPVSGFQIWPPMAIQLDLWAHGGIGPGRIAVMKRVQGPKTSILARTNDQPAGTAFVAIHDSIAMIHAIEVVPKLRRKGVGENILRTAAHWAAGHGATKMALVVTTANTGANALYTTLGMKVVGHYHYRIK